ncbi:unnamed protein product [Phyllotreta striolata]|uniref:Uncharacterized protein n=1 Tax=Phyllotreta striolata TaxID=444603 RepID=A0A9N9XNK6_PHYSR|nr:unnamed protein product [Phyllotreta striolata]
MKLIILALALIKMGHSFPQQPVSNEPIAIVKYENEGVNADGSYTWSLETANGIKAEERGIFKPGPNEDEGILEVSGMSEYTDNEGNPVRFSYIANENGFQPQGDHIPTPPPIPPAIQRSLDFLASHAPAQESEGSAL